ncbi:hypothetical protein K435DRAFT_809996 [Dendrothele bispora CBS 962.96]|uniref:Uncharacterized protein n=1 Tax=Dendrothele bispora (strain CBS 962.96) TaxID=1314807 RepID=A0A4S8KWE6_DENBC|nr:hypothetical protein K435DRAFT_809996 [Dendrothele bispora CBS 962.96]
MFGGQNGAFGVGLASVIDNKTHKRRFPKTEAWGLSEHDMSRLSGTEYYSQREVPIPSNLKENDQMLQDLSPFWSNSNWRSKNSEELVEFLVFPGVFEQLPDLVARIW